jgi:hypothetical protein
MNFELLPIFQLIASFGLVAAVAGYVTRIRGDQKQARLHTFHKYSEKYAALMGALLEQVDGFERDFDPGISEQRKLCLQLFFLFSEEFYLAREEKLIRSTVWGVWADGIQDLMGRPYFQQAWRFCQRQADFEGPFANFIEQRRDRWAEQPQMPRRPQATRAA